MKKNVAVAVLGWMAVVAADAPAEEVACAPGHSCEMGLHRKLERSAGAAYFIASGTLGPSGGNSVETLSPTEALLPVVFEPMHVYKGSALADKMRLKIPVLAVPAAKGATPSVLLATTAQVARLRQLERDLETARIARVRYEAERTRMHDELARSALAAPGRAVVVAVKRGSLDNAYRAADVPLILGEKYVLFITRTLDSEPTTTLFAWDLDLYPLSDPAVAQAVRRVLGGTSGDSGKSK